jgi:hypothetical protein
MIGASSMSRFLLIGSKISCIDVKDLSVSCNMLESVIVFPQHRGAKLSLKSINVVIVFVCATHGAMRDVDRLEYGKAVGHWGSLP